jgi:hypothetical protein
LSFFLPLREDNKNKPSRCLYDLIVVNPQRRPVQARQARLAVRTAAHAFRRDASKTHPPKAAGAQQVTDAAGQLDARTTGAGIKELGADHALRHIIIVFIASIHGACV